MGRLRDFLDELKARRDGRKFMQHKIRRSARDIIGPTGWAFSNAWDHLDQDEDAYLDSFDPRIPPSLHISQRDRTRLNIPIPLPERALEDHSEPREWDIAELDED